MSRIWVLLFLLITGGCSTPPGVKQDALAPAVVLKVSINPEYEKYVVANLATMKLRVYQRSCETCTGELIFTTDMVVGKDFVDERTKVGFYKIHSWVQFHEDYEKRYIAWNKNTPKPGSARGQWGSIGAFGWYAAILDPAAGGQWMHGTLGWASEGESFIEPTINANGTFIRLKSHGCTRVSNPAIAFLKDNVPKGSYVFRIYAKEEMSGEQPIKEVAWSHTLIYRKKVLDQGSWTRDVRAEPLAVQNKKDKVKGARPNNPYELEVDSLGSFMVDKGQIKGYQHPKKLKSGGLPIAPEFFIFKE